MEEMRGACFAGIASRLVTFTPWDTVLHGHIERLAWVRHDSTKETAFRPQLTHIWQTTRKGGKGGFHGMAVRTGALKRPLDDDERDYIGKRLKLEGETETIGVCTKVWQGHDSRGTHGQSLH